MEKTQNIWGGLATGYFFLAGTAAMMGIIVALMDIAGTGVANMVTISGLGEIMLPYLSMSFTALVTAFLLAGIGGMLLLAELTHKFRFPRVFANPKSLMTIGAFALSAFIGLTFIYALFFLNIIPFRLTVLRLIVATLLIIAAIVLASYPALEMAEARGRSFWSAGLVPLFLLNAFVCGVALMGIIGFSLRAVLFVGILFNLVVLIGYMWSAELSGIAGSRRGYDLLVKGSLRGVFMGGAVIGGLLLPAIILWFSPALAGVLAFIGGACFRYAFMKAGLRLELPGERNEKYPDKEITDLACKLEARWQEKIRYTRIVLYDKKQKEVKYEEQ